MIKVAITGHRPNKLGNDYDLTSNLMMRIKGEILDTLWMIDKDWDLKLITGMALGIDTLFAKIAIELNIPFIAAIPCLRHDSKWIDKSRYEYGQILMNKLCTVHLVSNCEYNSSVMQKRNKWMVDNCDYLIAVWDGTPGGTANCVKYAESVKKNIFRIDPNNL